MNITDLQILLARSTYYAGAIDGDAGPQTWAAIEIIERTSRQRYATNPKRWSAKRRMRGAGQAVLDALGYEPGAVDGYYGHNTANALAAFLSREIHGKPVPRPKPSPEPASSGHDVSDTRGVQYPTERGLTSYYGPPAGGDATAGRVECPFPLRVAWNKRQTVRSIRCHRLIADPLAAVLAEIHDTFGSDDIREMGLDLYGGCYNPRKKRGGSSWSTHAWGIALDFHPDANQLRWGRDRALFARPEYAPYLDIWQRHGATNLGRAANFDFMHFQWART